MLCSLDQVHQCFRGTYCLHIQGQRVSQAKLTVVTIKKYYLLGCNVYSHRSLMFWRSFYLIIWHHIPEDNTLFIITVENLKSDNSILPWDKSLGIFLVFFILWTYTVLPFPNSSEQLLLTSEHQLSRFQFATCTSGQKKQKLKDGHIQKWTCKFICY
jgi:hypothetical protein